MPDPPDHPEVDELLGKALQPALSSGFADRVIARVHSSEAPPRFAAHLGLARSYMAWAGSIAICGGLVWLAVFSAGPQARVFPGQASAPTEEEMLLKALATLEVNSGDLALVAQLGEVLEAELSERTSWLEKE